MNSFRLATVKKHCLFTYIRSCFVSHYFPVVPKIVFKQTQFCQCTKLKEQRKKAQYRFPFIPPLVERGLYCNHLVSPFTLQLKMSLLLLEEMILFLIHDWHSDLYHVSPFQACRTSTSCLLTYGDFPARDLQVLFARLYTFHFQTFAGHVTVPLKYRS